MLRRLVVRGFVGVAALSFAVPLQVTGAAASTPAGGPSVSSSQPLFEARTGPFVVYAEGRATAHRVAARLAEFAGVLSARGHEPPAGVPVRVLLTTSERSFHELAGSSPTAPVHAVAAVILVRGEPWIVVDAKERGEDTNASLYRAYVQLVLGLEDPPLPVWFRDGMAEYYRTFNGLGTTAVLGRAVREHVYGMREQPFIPWDRFFTMTRAEVDAQTRAQRDVFTAQAWLVVHSQFAEGRQGKERLAQLLDIHDGNALDVVRRAFDADFDGLTRTMREYVRRERLTYRQVEEAMKPAGEILVLNAKTDKIYDQVRAARRGAAEVVALGSTRAPDNYQYPVAKDQPR